MAQYYVLDAVLGFVDEELSTEANKTSQSRPKVVSAKSAAEIVDFLKECKDMV